MKSILSNMLICVLLGVALFAGTAHAVDEAYHSHEGSFSGDLIRVKWRRMSHSSYYPDLVVRLESSSAEVAHIKLDWDPVVCNGHSIKVSDGALWFLKMLYHPSGRQSTLRQVGDWDLFTLPLGMAIEQANTLPKDVQCIARVVVLATSESKKSDQLTIEVSIVPTYPEQRRLGL